MAGKEVCLSVVVNYFTFEYSIFEVINIVV